VEQFVPSRGHFLDLSLIGSFGNVKHMSFKKDPFESFNFVLNQYTLPSCTTYTSLPFEDTKDAIRCRKLKKHRNTMAKRKRTNNDLQNTIYG
jgi:hypothetical protein